MSKEFAEKKMRPSGTGPIAITTDDIKSLGPHVAGGIGRLGIGGEDGFIERDVIGKVVEGRRRIGEGAGEGIDEGAGSGITDEGHRQDGYNIKELVIFSAHKETISGGDDYLRIQPSLIEQDHGTIKKKGGETNEGMIVGSYFGDHVGQILPNDMTIGGDGGYCYAGGEDYIGGEDFISTETI